MFIAANPCPRPEPQRPSSILADCLHHRVIRKSRAARNPKAPVVKHAESAMRAHPEVLLTVFEQRRHQLVRVARQPWCSW